jgi:Tripartite tricarboxylate transporter family receptor
VSLDGRSKTRPGHGRCKTCVARTQEKRWWDEGTHRAIGQTDYAEIWIRIARALEIINKLNEEINAALTDPKVKARIADLGGTALAGSPAEFREFIGAYTEKWSKVIKLAGIKVD